MPGGNHPPPAHCHPGPGCGVVHPADAAGWVDGTQVADEATAAGGVIPGGSQPPP